MELKIELGEALHPPSRDPLLQQPASALLPTPNTPLFTHESTSASEPASALFWRGGGLEEHGCRPERAAACSIRASNSRSSGRGG